MMVAMSAASSVVASPVMRTPSPFVLTLPGRSTGTIRTRRHSLQQQHLAKPYLDGLCRRAAPFCPRRHIVIDDAHRRNLAALADRNMVVDPHSRAKHDKIAQRDTAGNSGLSHDHAMSADDDIVRDVDKIVD